MAGDLLAALRSAGVTVPFNDALIAAVAISAGLELWTRDTHRSRLDRPSPAQDFLAHRQAEPRLLLMPHQRQVDVEQIFGFTDFAGRKQRAHLDQSRSSAHESRKGPTCGDCME